MGVQDLQTYLEGGTVQGSCSNVDLVRIAKTMSARFVKQAQKKGANHQPNQFSLVVDGECCLDRLYGGYFSDWACGGQWNRMVMFLSQFVNSLKKANIDLVVFFNGCIEPQRMKEWVQQQQQTRIKVNQVLRHITTKGTPPPKVWWTPPVCLRTAVRMVLRHLEVTVMCTMDDHHQEVIAYCRENALHGLLADDAEYAAFDPPRYFSARQLKLTYKGSLETKEYNLSELNKELGLSTEKLCILVALLGNYILTENDLVDIYKKQGINQPVGKIPAEVLVDKMAALVKSLPAGEKLADTCAAILGSDKDPRLAKLKQSIQYYLDGTKDGFLDYRAANTGKKHRGNKNKQDHSAADKQNAATAVAASASTTTTTTATTDTIQEPDLDTTRLASETAESEMTSLQQYKEATAAMPPAKPEIIIDDTGKEAPEPEVAAATTGSEPEPPLVNGSGSPVQNGGAPNQLAIDSSSSNSSSPGATSPARGESAGPTNSKKGGKKDKEGGGKGGGKGGQPIQLPPVASEVMRTVSERHNKGLMSPFMYQILAQGEIKLPVIMEDEQHKEIPSIHLFYKPIRQMVYAILFNMHHHTFMANKNKEKTGQEGKLPDIRIKEWVCTKNNPYNKPEIVKAESLGWGVPTVQRLWFGTTMDDMRRRRRAYLTCMRSDTPLIVNYDYVPQHILIMATVLRYMMSFPEKKVLRRSELDAFIVTTLAPELMNAEYNQELQLPVVTSRGVQLATMFMQGVETALLVNDACGAPIPWLMCCPWLFFDGKLFHHHLARASQAKNLSELCEHRLRVIMKVERVRQAILEGMNVQFARPPLPLVIQNTRASPLYPTPGAPPGAHAHMLAAGMVQSQRGANQAPPNSHLSSALASHAHASMLSARGGVGGVLSRRAAGIPSNSGGRLEIAGVVVGSWGPNYGLSTLGVNRSMMLQPQVTSVNAVSNYTGVSFRGGRPSFNTNRGGGVNKGGKGRGFKAQQTNKKRSTSVGSSQKKENKKTGKGRGMTVVLPDTGETVLATEIVDDVSDKKILMNRTNANNTEMMNGKAGSGGGGGDDLIGQFEDACTIENGAMNGEGDVKISSILAAATEGN